MFRKYSTMLPKSQHLSMSELQKRPKLISQEILGQFLRDFQVEQSEFLKTEEVKRLVVMINKKYERPNEFSHSLDLEGFVEFLL